MSLENNLTDAAGPRTWATATARHENNGRAIIFCFIHHVDPAFDQQAQPVHIIFSWNYESKTGMPVSGERERMDAMEDALEPHVERNGFANLVLVSTGEGLREWTYYAASCCGSTAH